MLKTNNTSMRRELFVMNYSDTESDMKIDPTERASYINHQNLKQYEHAQYNKKLIDTYVRTEQMRTDRIRRAIELDSRAGQNVDMEV